MLPFCNESTNHIYTRKKYKLGDKRIEYSPAEEGSHPSALSCQTSPGALYPVVESSAQERHGPVGECPEEGNKNDPRDGTSLL